MKKDIFAASHSETSYSSIIELSPFYFILDVLLFLARKCLNQVRYISLHEILLLLFYPHLSFLPTCNTLSHFRNTSELPSASRDVLFFLTLFCMSHSFLSFSHNSKVSIHTFHLLLLGNHLVVSISLPPSFFTLFFSLRFRLMFRKTFHLFYLPPSCIVCVLNL